MVALAKSSDTLTLADLPADLREEPDDEALEVGSAKLETLKRSAILQALRQFDGNRTRAADFLGISVRTLQRKPARLGHVERRARRDAVGRPPTPSGPAAPRTSFGAVGHLR